MLVTPLPPFAPSSTEGWEWRLWPVHHSSSRLLLPPHAFPLLFVGCPWAAASFRACLAPLWSSMDTLLPHGLLHGLQGNFRCREISTAASGASAPPLLTLMFAGLFLSLLLTPHTTMRCFALSPIHFSRGTTHLAAGRSHALLWERPSRLEPAVESSSHSVPSPPPPAPGC